MKFLKGTIIFITLIMNCYAVDFVRDYPNNTHSRSTIIRESFDQNFYEQGDVRILYHYFNDEFAQGGLGPFYSGTNTILVIKVKNKSFTKRFFIQYKNSSQKTQEIEATYAGSDNNGYDYFHILLSSRNQQMNMQYKLITVLNYSFDVFETIPTYGRENRSYYDGVKGNKYEIDLQIDR